MGDAGEGAGAGGGVTKKVRLPQGTRDSVLLIMGEISPFDVLDLLFLYVRIYPRPLAIVLNQRRNVLEGLHLGSQNNPKTDQDTILVVRITPKLIGTNATSVEKRVVQFLHDDCTT